MRPSGQLPRRWTWAIAVALLLGTCALLLATSDMGFTRDESFYFDYSQAYNEWFTDLEQAERPERIEEVLGRKNVVKVWRGNFEHPPLMKTLFGWSWQTFGRKLRDASRLRSGGEGGAVRFTITGLRASEGFAEGSEVLLLAPQALDQEATDRARRLARGRVIKRQPRRAEALLEDVELTELSAACKGKAGDVGPPRLMTGCQAVEDRALAVLSEADAMRLPGMLATAFVVMLTFLLGTAMLNWQTGLFAALAFLFVPRHFFHAHLACFDMPIVAATAATLYAFWQSRDDRRWALAAGVFWGMALLTKHNAFFLPAPLVLYWLWADRHRFRLELRRWPPRIRLPPIPLALLVMPVIALPMLFVFWPRMWYDPAIALTDYLGFHTGHVHYFQWYFGEPLNVPPFPFEFPFALTLYTVPEVLLALSAAGFYFLAPLHRARQWLRALRRKQEPTPRERALVFCLLNGLIPILVIAIPSVPIFGGVKHWMTGMPFIMLLAGYGFYRLLRLALERVSVVAVRAVVAGALVVAVFAQPVHSSLRTNEFGTSYYNSLLAGGIPGAADAQMMRMYWGYTSRAALDWLNRYAPRNARVYFQNTTYGAYRFYQRDGLLRHDIRHHGGHHGADLALIEPQKSFAEVDLEVRNGFGVVGPIHTVTLDGVPMLRIYARPSVKLSDAGARLPEDVAGVAD